jgi:hypothetical protein
LPAGRVQPSTRPAPDRPASLVILLPTPLAPIPVRSARRRKRRLNVKKILLLVVLIALGALIAKKVREG